MLPKLTAKDRRWVDTLERVRKPKVKWPVIDGDRVLVTRGWAPPGSRKFFDAGDLRALSLADGRPQWEVYEEGTFGFAVDRVADVIWWFGFFGEVTRLSPDGAQLTRTEVLTDAGSYDQFTSVQITEGTIVAATADDKLVWFAENGDIDRILKLDGRPVRPAIGGDVVVSGWNQWNGAGYDGQFLGLDAATGEQRWSLRADGYAQDAAVIGDYTRLLNADGPPLIVETATGEAWQWDDGEGLGPILNSPTELDEPLFSWSEDHESVVCLDPPPGLSRRWQSPPLRAPVASVCAVDDTVLVLTGDGRLHALDAADGSLGWQISLGAAKFGNPPDSHVAGPGYLVSAPGALVVAQARSVAAYSLG